MSEEKEMSIRNKTTSKLKAEELVINWHITEACNYDCGFCFAKWKKPNELHTSFDKVESLLKLLSDYFISGNSTLKKELGYKIVRLNFAGGEPLMLGNKFFKILSRAKSFGFMTSLITNGHHLIHGKAKIEDNSLDMLGISFDSQIKAVQCQIGRVDRKGISISKNDLCDYLKELKNNQNNIKIKMNTVVNLYNWKEDFAEFVFELNLYKWKVFRALPYKNHKLVISDKEYEYFLNKHQGIGLPIYPESNISMIGSYLMIDPSGRFYQNNIHHRDYTFSQPINQSGVHDALKQIEFNPTAFLNRYTLKS